MAKEALDLVIETLEKWNRANTKNIKPVILDIADATPERGKRQDLQRSDFVLLYETAHNEDVPDLLYNFVMTRINITVDIRTAKSRAHLRLMEDELRRLIHADRKGDGVNFDRMLFKTRTDLSDRTKKLFRHTFQVEVVVLADPVGA
jgi:hypothetical protein